MADDSFSRLMASTPNSVEQALSDKRGINHMLADVWTAEPAIVHKYNAATQRVDLWLKNAPASQVPLLNVPIYNTSGRFRIFQPLVASANPITNVGDVGVVLFTRTDTRETWGTRQLTGRHAGHFHKGTTGALFIPGPLTGGESMPPTFSNLAGPSSLDNFGPNDAAIVHQSGSHIIFKENGEIVIKGSKVYIGSDNDNVVDFKEVARKGDTVQVGASSGTITSGSANILGGD